MKNLVFTYGTLRTGETNARLLAGVPCLGTFKTVPRYTMISLGAFPGIIERGDTAIVGELYEVDDATLASLDRLEGHPHFYTRMAVELDAEAGQTGLVQGYVLPDGYSTRPVMPTGDWRSSPYSRHYKGKGGPAGAFASDDSPEECD